MFFVFSTHRFQFHRRYKKCFLQYNFGIFGDRQTQNILFKTFVRVHCQQQNNAKHAVPNCLWFTPHSPNHTPNDKPALTFPHSTACAQTAVSLPQLQFSAKHTALTYASDDHNSCTSRLFQYPCALPDRCGLVYEYML